MIVVIAILAALSYVGYTSVQNRARIALLQADARNIGQALNLYKAEHGRWPICSGGEGMSCDMSTISPLLREITGVPTTTDNGATSIRYVANNASDRWAIRLISSSDFCKSGYNMSANWFTESREC